MQDLFIQSGDGLYLPQQATYHQHKSGLLLPKREYDSPIAIDLFSGCGGFSLGMIDGGFQVIAAVDQDPSGALTYLANLGAYPLDLNFVAAEDEAKFTKLLEQIMQPGKDGEISQCFLSGQHRSPDRPGVEHFWLGDIRQLTGQQILDAIGIEVGEVDCVFGGPPCQGFSRAGKRDVLDPRNSLIFEFARMILEIRPKTFVMENVPGILSMITPEGVPVIDAFCRVIADGGFSTYDALRRSLHQQAEAFGGVYQPNSSKKRKGKVTDCELQSQLSLFG
jgi:DNA (cytosine-5)-methyltransferase 1